MKPNRPASAPRVGSTLPNGATVVAVKINYRRPGTGYVLAVREGIRDHWVIWKYDSHILQTITGVPYHDMVTYSGDYHERFEDAVKTFAELNMRATQA